MKFISAGALMVACLALALASGACLALRLTSAAAPLARVLPSADLHAQAADAAFVAHDWARARSETRAELQVSPVRATAWLRLARIDETENGRLGPEGIEALRHAYDAEPYDLSADGARRRFVAQHTVELPSDIHAQVDLESSATAHQY